MRRGLITGGTLGGALVLAAVALAQPRAGRPSHGAPKPKPSASGSADNPYDERTPSAPPGPSATPPPSSTPPGDAGPAPPPTADVAEAGARLSPLNPAPNEMSDAGIPPASVDYDRLLSDVASLRARVAAVSDTLFHSRIAISLETTGDHGQIASLSIAVDDGVVWTSPATFRADDATTVYDHSAAPGHHAVTIDIERRDDREATFRSSQRSRFVIDVPADERLSVDVKLWDDSAMGADFPTGKKGQYDLRVRARAQVQRLER